MSQPFEQQQSPAIGATQSQRGMGSIGPVIAVLAVIAVLGFVAGVIGRLCAGRRILGYGRRYDLEGWAETKCSSCIGGRMEQPSPPAQAPNANGGAGPRSTPAVGSPGTQEEA